MRSYLNIQRLLLVLRRPVRGHLPHYLQGMLIFRRVKRVGRGDDRCSGDGRGEPSAVEQQSVDKFVEGTGANEKEENAKGEENGCLDWRRFALVGGFRTVRAHFDG